MSMMLSRLRASVFLVLLSVIGSPVLSQDAQRIKVDLDFASFAYDEDSSLLEVYLAFGTNTLSYESDSSGLSAVLPLELRLDHATVTTLLDDRPDPVWTDTIRLQVAVADSSFLRPETHFLHQVRAAVPPGEYVMRLTIPADSLLGRREQKVARDVVVPDFGDTSVPSVSDIELATSVQTSSERTAPFYKNGLEIKPNPHLLFGGSLTRVFYYVEGYNIPSAISDTVYTAYVFISESTFPQPLAGLENRSKRQVRSPDVIVGSFDIGALPSGSYLMNIVLLDGANRSMVEQKRKFFVYNPAVQAFLSNEAVDQAYETSMYAAMSTEELDEQIKYADIISTSREHKALKGAKNDDGKREALQAFWSKRDPNPSTPINEVREEYFSRLRQARERYSNGHTEGWRTDRGRVYLKYGIPGHVNPHHYERDSAPYEIWEYDNIPGEGNAMFVFADVGGFNEFEMIHSNVRGERQSMDWRAEIRN